MPYIAEWKPYVENDGKQKQYKCVVCKGYGGRMFTRMVTEVTDGSHWEYMIRCETCQHKGSVHWNKTLAEHTWKAESDPYYEEQKRVLNLKSYTALKKGEKLKYERRD